MAALVEEVVPVGLEVMVVITTSQLHVFLHVMLLVHLKAVLVV
jgi:hypothetical protein